MSPLTLYLKSGDQVPGWLVNYTARMIADIALLQTGLSYRPKLVTAGIGKAAYRGGA
jgi:hypothetical protein